MPEGGKEIMEEDTEKRDNGLKQVWYSTTFIKLITNNPLAWCIHPYTHIQNAEM